jgi:hypothetical protein
MAETTVKAFDCVQMKWAIQERLQKEFADLTPERRRVVTQQRTAQDSILGPFLRNVSRHLSES